MVVIIFTDWAPELQLQKMQLRNCSYRRRHNVRSNHNVVIIFTERVQLLLPTSRRDPVGGIEWRNALSTNSIQFHKYI
jgi:hypothetical protein